MPQNIACLHEIDNSLYSCWYELYRMLYWTDTSERGPAIYRSSVVNASLETLVSVNLGWPNALTVDFTGKQEKCIMSTLIWFRTVFRVLWLKLLHFHLSVLLDCVSLCLCLFVFVVYRYCICLTYLILFNSFLLGLYLVLYLALLSCLDYCFYSLIFFLVLLSVHSFIHF